MAECEVFEGDGHRPKEPDAEERPQPDHEYHRRTPASGMASEPRVYRISGGGGSGKFRPNKETEFLTGTGGTGGGSGLVVDQQHPL